MLFRSKCGEGIIHVFFACYSGKETLHDTWREVSNTIAAYFQAKVEDDFGKWNTYLFYMTDFKVDKALKYKIENDTFSSRKTVIDEKMDLNLIIKKHILNDNLSIGHVSEKNIEEDHFQSNKLVWDLLKDKMFKNVGIDGETKDLFNQLVEAVKEEGNEI